MPDSLAETRPDWLEPLKDPRNEQILGAAFEVFVEKGLRAATMAEIAARAEISPTALFDRFDSKEGLLYALLAWGTRDKAESLDDAVLAADPLGALHMAVRTTLNIMMQPESLALHRLITAEGCQAPDVAQVYDEFTCGVGREVSQRLANALADKGIIEIETPGEFVDVYLSLICGPLHRDAAMGLRPIPGEAEIAAWADMAARRLLKAFSPA